MTQDAASLSAPGAAYGVARRSPQRPPFTKAFPHLGTAAKTVSSFPLVTAAWALGLVAVIVVAPIWGATFALMGWLSARERMRAEGLIGLGDLLAPSLASAQFKNGLFRGIWRVHKLSIAVTLVQLPTVLLALSPAAIAYALFSPALMTFPGSAGMIIAWGLPGLVALGCAVLVLAHQLLTYRILAASGPNYSLGLVFRCVGESWRITLSHGAMVYGLALGMVGVAVLSGAFVGGSLYLADTLQLGGSVLILTWTGALAGLVFLTLTLEALASWAQSVQVQRIEAPEAFSFSSWFVGWAKGVVDWLAARGIVSVGIGACLLVGVATAAGAFVTGQTFTSWVGLGWFAVTAAVLVMLHLKARRA